MMLIVSVILLQVWVTAASECGLSPHVSLTCTDGSAHVDWAPSQSYCSFDCKAYWTCRHNGTDVIYRDESSDYTCNSNGWNFFIPWDHYFCSVTVFYKYFSLTTFSNRRSPDTIKSCSGNSIALQHNNHFEVGRHHEINCTLYTGEAVNSSEVDISWIGPDGVIANESSRITVVPTTSDGYIHTSTLQFSYISEEDENTSYNCTASLSGDHEPLSKLFTMSNITIPTPIVSVTALRDNPAVGKSFPLECNVTVAKGIKSSVDIIWTVNGIVERNYTMGNTVWDTKSQYVDVYNIAELQLSDNNTVYYCKAVINAHTYAESNVTIDNVTFVELQTDNHFEMGRHHEINCTLYTGEAVNSSKVDISWIGPHGVIASESSRITVVPTTSDGYIHTSTLQFLYISEEDENASYNCTASLSGEHEPLSKSFTMTNLTIPTPSVSVTTLRDNPTVGKSFPLECNVTVAKGIKSSVDIIWTVNGIVERNYTVDHTVWDTKSQYVDVYNIVELQLSDNNTVYYCKAVINAHTYAESNVTIDSVAFATDEIPILNSMMTPIPTIMIIPVADDSSFPAATIFSSILAVIIIGFIICFIGFVIIIYIRKRDFQFKRANPQEDKPIV